MVNCYGLSDIGKYREKNEDSYRIMNDKYGNVFCVVCDGIGGSNAGDVASHSLCDNLENEFNKNRAYRRLFDSKKAILNNIIKANKKLYELSLSDDSYSGMGTTLTGIYFSKYGCFTVNIGDSRVYGYKDNKLELLTDDDSLVNEMYKRGEITKEEMEKHPNRHYLTKALGMTLDVDPAFNEAKDYDYYLVCSDGLHGYVNDEEIINILNKEILLKDKCAELINLALNKGGYDNITVVLCESCQK